jgi:glycosyltransferase involved in cell wall biosynthesis
MKALFVDQYGQLGGAQRCLLDLLPALPGNGWQAMVAAPASGPLLALAVQARAEAAALPVGDYSSNRKPVSEWPRFVKESILAREAIDGLVARFRPDLIYVNGPRVLPASAFAVRRSALPLLYHCHHRLTQPAAIQSVRGGLRLGRATVVSCCRYAVEPLLGAVAEDRVHVVYNGVRGPSGPNPTRSPGKFRAGVIGRIAPGKGQLEFVRAVRQLVADGAACEFIVCGEPLFHDDEAERYFEQVRAEADGLPVEFLGWRDDVYEVIRTLDLVVVPSTQEPATTRVILEAYACGAPVVAFASGGIPEVVRDGETGVLVEPFTAEALAEAMLGLIGDAKRRAELSRNGRAEWERRYRLDRYQQDIIGLMAAVGTRNPAGQR